MARKRRLGAESSPFSKMKSESKGDDVMVARDRLKGALHDLLHSDEETSSSQEDMPTTPSKTLHMKKDVKPPLIRRRKRKLPLELEVGFHHTFVMKLFDRSVDLAQFKEDTPLYPICRAWIANQPRVPAPYPTVDDVKIKEEGVSINEYGYDDITDVHTLPPPSSHPWQGRIPYAETPRPCMANILDYSSENLPTAEELLNEHLGRWVNIRQQWVEAAKQNEKRFEKSGSILYNIFKRAQNAMQLG